MKMKDIKSKSPNELQSFLLELKKELFNLRFRKAAGDVVNTSRIRIVRKAIARVNTLFNSLVENGGHNA
jgi:large subunit ribosomal protein L29